MTAIVESGPEKITIRGRKVPVWFIDELGRRYEFESMAVLDKDGGFEMSQLTANQCIIAPGAIYELKVQLTGEMELEQDNIKKGQMAVYHYSLIPDLTCLKHRRDGVITMPVIAGAGDYQLAKHLIAEEEGIPVDDMHLTSLSFVGETAPSTSNNGEVQHD